MGCTGGASRRRNLPTEPLGGRGGIRRRWLPRRPVEVEGVRRAAARAIRRRTRGPAGRTSSSCGVEEAGNEDGDGDGRSTRKVAAVAAEVHAVDRTGPS